MCLLSNILTEFIPKAIVKIICDFIGHAKFNFDRDNIGSNGIYEGTLILEAGHTLDDTILIPYYRTQDSINSLPFDILAKEIKHLILTDCLAMDYTTIQVLSKFLHIKSLDVEVCTSLGTQTIQMLKELKNLTSLTVGQCDFAIKELGKSIAQLPRLTKFNHGMRLNGEDGLNLYHGARLLDNFRGVTDNVVWYYILTRATSSKIKQVTDCKQFPMHLLADGQFLSIFKKQLFGMQLPLNIGHQIKHLTKCHYNSEVIKYIAINCPNLETLTGSGRYFSTYSDLDMVFNLCTKLTRVELESLSIINFGQFMLSLNQAIERGNLKHLALYKVTFPTAKDCLEYYDFCDKHPGIITRISIGFIGGGLFHNVKRSELVKWVNKSEDNNDGVDDDNFYTDEEVPNDDDY